MKRTLRIPKPKGEKKDPLSHILKFGTIKDDLLRQIQGYTLPPESVDRLKFCAVGRSQAESRWLKDRAHSHLIEDATGARVKIVLYEWMAFKLPGLTYTPDYDYILSDGRIAFVEIKGSKGQANYRDARTHLRVCASLNPWFTFFEAIDNHGVFDLELIKPDAEFIADMIAYLEDHDGLRA